jgi:hypothetical protein
MTSPQMSTMDLRETSSQESLDIPTLDTPHESNEALQGDEPTSAGHNSPRRGRHLSNPLVRGDGSRGGLHLRHGNNHERHSGSTSPTGRPNVRFRQKFKKVLRRHVIYALIFRLLTVSERPEDSKLARNSTLAPSPQNPDWITRLWTLRDSMVRQR